MANQVNTYSVNQDFWRENHMYGKDIFLSLSIR